jgi:hypothetical protein
LMMGEHVLMGDHVLIVSLETVFYFRSLTAFTLLSFLTVSTSMISKRLMPILATLFTYPLMILILRVHVLVAGLD